MGGKKERGEWERGSRQGREAGADKDWERGGWDEDARERVGEGGVREKEEKRMEVRKTSRARQQHRKQLDMCMKNN